MLLQCFGSSDEASGDVGNLCSLCIENLLHAVRLLVCVCVSIVYMCLRVLYALDLSVLGDRLRFQKSSVLAVNPLLLSLSRLSDLTEN